MSATILKDRIVAEIVNLLNENGRQMMNLRYQPAQGATVGGSAAGGVPPVGAGVLPAVTAEEIGIRAAELNAYRRGLMDAAGAVEEQHKALVAPEEKPDALVEGRQQPNGAERPEAVY